MDFAINNDMISKGYPVTWLFLVFILTAYIILFVQDMQRENVRLDNIIEQQTIIINEQEKKIKEMNQLIEAMFEYMDAVQPGRKNVSPGNGGSPWYEGIENRLI